MIPREKIQFHLQLIIWVINYLKLNQIYKIDLVNVANILQYSPFKELNDYDKEVLVYNQYSLTQIDTAIPKLLSCLDFYKLSEKKKLDKVLRLCKPIPLVQALKLLSGDFLCEQIRKYAVSSLELASLIDIQEHLLQIVQALKYEMYHDSFLARFILKKAIQNPLNLGIHLITTYFKVIVYFGI